MSASAANCAAEFPCLLCGRGLRSAQLLLKFVFNRSVSICPDWSNFSLCAISCFMLELLREVPGVGARVNRSKLSNSHQKHAASFVVFASQIVLIMLLSSL